MVASGVDLTEVGLRAGSLRIRRLGAVRSGSAANFGGAPVVEVLEAAGGAEVGAGAPGGEAGHRIGGAAGEEAGNEAGKSEGGYFENAAGGAGRFSGTHSGLQRQMCSKCRTSGDFSWRKVNFVGSGGQ